MFEDNYVINEADVNILNKYNINHKIFTNNDEFHKVIIIHNLSNKICDLIPTINQVQFFTQFFGLCNDLCLTNDIILNAIVLCIKYYSKRNKNLCSDLTKLSDIMYLLLVLIQLSCKFTNDESLTNHDLSRFAHISMKRLFDNEKQFMMLFEWNLFITNDDIKMVSEFLHIPYHFCYYHLSSYLFYQNDI